MIWSWIPGNAAMIRQLTLENAYLGILPALLGLVISVPLGIACVRWGWLYPPVLSVTSLLYALPSLALFIVLIPYTGLTDTTVIIPLTLFSLCVLSECGGRAPLCPGPGPAGRHRHGLRRAAPPGPGRTTDRGADCDRRPAGRDGVEHQPGQHRPAHRGQQPRVPVHRRLPA